MMSRRSRDPAVKPWMWLLRELFPYLPPVLVAMARLVLALVIGAAVLAIVLRGDALPAGVLRALATIIH
jgi:hypothetical protein